MDSQQVVSNDAKAHEWELSSDQKDKTQLGVEEGELHYSSEEGEKDFRHGAVVETAGDLVAQIINLEDDPKEQSLTFRTWFLGEWKLLLGHISAIRC